MVQSDVTEILDRPLPLHPDSPDGRLDVLDDAVMAQLFTQARTALQFADAEVPDELLERVHDLVRWGPTAMNTSPLRLLAVRSAEGRARLASHMAGFNTDRVLDAPLSLVVATDSRFHEHLDVLVPHDPAAGERVGGMPDAVRERMARDNAWLQAGYLLVGLRAAGLDVGPMTGMDAAGIDSDLLAGTGWRALMVVNVGFPAAEPTDRPRAPRLAVRDTVRTV
jgi:3-hydroxypropanoate dehydrogenase